MLCLNLGKQILPQYKMSHIYINDNAMSNLLKLILAGRRG